ncbi:MAG TPA: amino acid adenylation domain-containing protein [Pyrinomonadaceae bacterium]|nr:amino acid adenylation domain-containing protein [Pyrinomonadaceae bacterium]
MKLDNVKDIYPLSPSQQAMLFQALYSPGTDENINQMVCTLRGDLNAAAFEMAWQRVAERNPVLSSAFAWDGLDEPLQIVRKKVKLPWEQIDWRSFSITDREAKLQSLLKADRIRGFKLAAAPLMRGTLIRIADDENIFIWTYHHLLLDGWCLGLIMKEVSSFYEAISKGEEPQLEPTRPFRDYIAWLQKRNGPKSETYWRRILKGYASPLHLMVDQNPGEVSEPGIHYERKLALSESTTEALSSLARSGQMTLYNLIQGAWAILLSQYSGESDLVFGVTVSGRPTELAGVQSMIGVFINTVPVRVQISHEMSLLQWLKKLNAERLEMFDYEYTSLAQIQRWSEIRHPLPLFETVLILEKFVAEDLTGQVIGGAQFVKSYAVEKMPIPLAVTLTPGARLIIQMTYQPEHFSAAAIERLLTHLKTLLECMASNPEQRVSDLTMLTPAERHQLLVEFNETRAGYPRDESVARLFEEQVRRTPDAVAVVDDEGETTYRELDTRANQLANYLRRLGVGPEVLVGICTERSTEMVVDLLATLKAGGAYVPLDPRYPQARLSYMMSDTRVRVILTQERFASLLSDHSATVICPSSSDKEAIAREDTQPPQNLGFPENLAYVIYTSGSTGKPKGVQISQRSLVNLLYAMKREPGCTEQDIFLSLTTLSFDIAALELFLPLIVGGRLIVLTHEAVRDNNLLSEHLANSGATMIQATPTLWRLLLDSDWKSSSHGLKVLSGGEPLPSDLANRLLEREACLWNLYGPTETTIWSTVHHVTHEADSIPIGRPIANTQTYILDSHLRPIPTGLPGQLYIGGDGLSRGYLGRPDLTAEKFIPNPFSGETGARMYCTGDRARYLPDGNIEFLGRVDQQIKLRGHRIEPAEIEAVMAEHAGVRECAVALHTGHGNQRLIGYVVPRRKKEPALQVLSDEKERLSAAHQYSKLPNGLFFLGHSAFQTGGLYREIYEDETYFKHGINLADGDCVFDVGANIGMFSLFVKDRWRNARVYAFEPLPLNSELLHDNMALYGLDVKVYDCGLSSRSGSATFNYYPNAPALAGIANAAGGRLSDKELSRSVRNWLQTVAPGADQTLLPEAELDQMVEKYLLTEDYICQLTTLSEIIRENNIDRIDLLKIDVETSEADVLAGLEESDWEKIRQVVMEVHSKELYDHIVPIFEKHGFNFAVERTFNDPSDGPQPVEVYMLYARREKEEIHSLNGQRDETTPLSMNDLRAFLKARLPDYMVPSNFVELDALPLSPSGKLNRKALPEPEMAGFKSETEYVEPRTHTEKVIAGIYAKVLGIERVGAGDNFFDFGGHSLQATQVVSRLRDAFAVDVTLRDIFEAPVVEALAKVIEQATNGRQNLKDVKSPPLSDDLQVGQDSGLRKHA